MSVFSSFNAYPVSSGNELLANWTYVSQFITDISNGTIEPNFLYLYVTDFSAVATGDTISHVVVVPLIDSKTGKLTTSFNIKDGVQGLSFKIQNGVEYQVMAEMIYTNSVGLQTETSRQDIRRCSTIPQVPNFSVIPSTQSFIIQLLTKDGTTPTPISEFDGYSTLEGIFVTYASGAQLYSKFIKNDINNSLYTTPQTIDASLNKYEVSISSYNFRTSNGVKWGGRSASTASQLVEVSNAPGPVRNLDVYETMVDFSSNQTALVAFTNVSNTIKWQVPNVGASAETITGYEIYRNNTLINSVSKDTFKYIDDDSTLVVDTSYNYAVRATNLNSDGSINRGKAENKTIRSVVFPQQTGFSVDPSGSTNLWMRVTNNTNGFPLADYSYDYSYNTTGRTPVLQTGQEKEYLATDLSNQLLYRVQVRTNVISTTKPSVTYRTSYWTPVVQATPYDPVLVSATDASLNPLDASLNPTGNIVVSWRNPSNPQPTGTMTYQLLRKLSTDDDASYSQISSGSSLGNQRQSVTDISCELGKSYRYKIVNRFVSGQQNSVSDGLVAGPIIPFRVPNAVRNLALGSITDTDMSFSFLAPDASNGYNISYYTASLFNLSDGSSVTLVSRKSIGLNTTNLLSQLNRLDPALTPAALAAIAPITLVQGNKYRLVIRPVVIANTGVGTTEPFYGPIADVINFTLPEGINGSNISVLNAKDGSLLNGLLLDWSAASQYDALDASSASFKIYKGGNLITTVADSKYLDTNVFIGATTQYQVVSSVNNVDASFVAFTNPTLTNPARRVALPNNVTGLDVSAVTIDSIEFKWNKATGSTGLADSSLNYLWQLTNTTTGNVDASGTTFDLSKSVTSLTQGAIYEIMVCSGIQNTDGELYHNMIGCPTITKALYNEPAQAQIEQIAGSSVLLGSSGALLANLVNATDADGLVFDNYSIQVATDASFNNLVLFNGSSKITSSSSEFYISGLTNGTTYYVRSTNNYLDNNNAVVSSKPSVTFTGIPILAPNQPTGLESNTSSNAQSVILYWSKPTGNDAQLVKGYSVQVSNNQNNLINNFNYDLLSSGKFPDATSPSGVVKYSYTINGLTAGKTYYFTVSAVAEITGGVSVSQPSQTITAIPFQKPSNVRNLTAVPNTTSIALSWDAPSSPNGAGQSPNGMMLYKVQLASDISFNNIVQDLSGIQLTNYTFTNLLVNSQYSVRVAPYFDIQGSGILTIGDFEKKTNVQTQSAPSESVLSATADNKKGLLETQRGRTCELEWTADPDFTGVTTIKRKVMNPTGSRMLNDFITIGSVALNGVSKATFTDDKDKYDPSGNFLNGNQVFYQIDVSYAITNGSPVRYTTSTITPVVPYDAPIPTDASGNFKDITTDLSSTLLPLDADGSGNYTKFRLFINKNGADITNIVAVGLNPDGSQAPVLTQTNPTITYSNAQVSGKIAENQYGSIDLTYPMKVNSTLAIETNKGGALLARQPITGSAFGPNVSQGQQDDILRP